METLKHPTQKTMPARYEIPDSLFVYRHVRIAGHSLCERPAILSSVLSSVRATQ
jgi:hypothetical protein